jgi:hypothetical protein
MILLPERSSLGGVRMKLPESITLSLTGKKIKVLFHLELCLNPLPSRMAVSSDVGADSFHAETL